MLGYATTAQGVFTASYVALILVVVIEAALLSWIVDEVVSARKPGHSHAPSSRGRADGN